MGRRRRALVHQLNAICLQRDKPLINNMSVPSSTITQIRRHSASARKQLQELLENGTPLNRELFEENIAREFPAKKFVDIPNQENLPTFDQIKKALNPKQSPFVNLKNQVQPGEDVTLRQDVNSWDRHGVATVTLGRNKGVFKSEPTTEFPEGQKSTKSYESIVRILSPKMYPTEGMQNISLKIGSGQAKNPAIVIKGKLHPDQTIPDDIKNWTQTGYNPDRHSYIYERATGMPIVDGDEAIAIGNTVFVKNPIREDPLKFMYGIAGAAPLLMGDSAEAKSTENKSNNMSYSREQLLDGLNKAAEAKDYNSANEIANVLDGMDKANPVKQERSFKESAGNIAGDIATEVGISLAGQGIGGMMGPGYFAVAPAAGAYGNYKSQQRQIERGDRAKYAPGEMLSAALINLLPGATLGKVAAPIAKAVAGSGGRLAQIGGAAAANAVIGGGIGAGAKTVETAVDDKRVPTVEEYASSILGGGALGAIIGGSGEASKGLLKVSKELWSKIKGKKVNELSAYEQDDPSVRALFRELSQRSREEAELVRPSTRQETEAILRDAPLIYTQDEIERGLRPVPVKSAKDSAEALNDLKRKEILAFEQKVKSEDVANRLRSQDFQKARLEEQKQIVEEARQIIEQNRLGNQESTTFTGSPEQTQLSRLDTERGNALRERARINEKLGRGPEQSLPTQQEVINEAANYPGIGSPSRAREMGLGALAVGGLGLAGGSDAQAAAASPNKTNMNVETQLSEGIGDESKTPIGYRVKYKGEELYFPFGTSMEKIQKNLSERNLTDKTREQLAAQIQGLGKMAEMGFENQSLLRKEEARNAPPLLNQIPPTVINALSMYGSPFTRFAGGLTADAISQYLNNNGKLSMPSAVRGGLTNLIPIKSGQTARNAALIGVGEAAGEVFEKAMDKKVASAGDVLRAGASGVAGIGTQGMVDRGRYAAKQFERRTSQGAHDLVTSANDLNLLIDPSMFQQNGVGPILVQASGGQNALRQYLSNKNQPQLKQIASEIAGFKGKDLSSDNFNGQLLLNGDAYRNFSTLGGTAPSLLKEWKDFSSDTRRLYRQANESGDSRIRSEAKAAQLNAENAFQKMEALAVSQGKVGLISELRIAKENTAKLYAIRAGTNEARNSFDAKVLGMMLEDGAGFTGSLKKLALIAQGMPDVVRDPFNSTLKFGIHDAARLAGIAGVGATAGALTFNGMGSAIGAGASLAVPFLSKRIGASPLVQNRSFLNPSSRQGTPDFLARVARFGTQGVFDQMTQQPQPANYSTF